MFHILFPSFPPKTSIALNSIYPMGAYSKVGAYLSEIPQGMGAYSKGDLLEGGA